MITRDKIFIIAEAGVNHNGSLELAKKLVDAAKEAGADAVKFQTFKTENLTTSSAELTAYQERNIGKKESQFELLKKLELSYEDFVKVKEYADQKGIIFSSTAHTEDALEFLSPLMPFFKIGSGDLNNLPLLEKTAKKGKPIILATGMATIQEVREAVNTIREFNNEELILLHCVTNYPCPLEEVNLKAMLALKEEFNLPIGYSDHSLGILVPVAAAALGAKVIEKHFTIDKNLPGPDHKLSLSPSELKEMVKGIRDIEVALGTGIKTLTESEKKIKEVIRKSIVAKEDISQGATITEDMLIVKRPGTGIEPKHLKEIIGKKALKPIKKDELITWEQVK